MDEDVPMDDSTPDAAKKDSEGLDEYNLEAYDDDDAMPGTIASLSAL